MLMAKPFVISSASSAVKKELGAIRKETPFFSILSTSPAGILLSVIV